MSHVYHKMLWLNVKFLYTNVDIITNIAKKNQEIKLLPINTQSHNKSDKPFGSYFKIDSFGRISPKLCFQLYFCSPHSFSKEFLFVMWWPRSLKKYWMLQVPDSFKAASFRQEDLEHWNELDKTHQMNSI